MEWLHTLTIDRAFVKPQESETLGAAFFTATFGDGDHLNLYKDNWVNDDEPTTE